MKVPKFKDHLNKMLENESSKEIFDAWDLPVRLSKELIAQRARLGLTQSELAARLGLPQQDISKVETLSGGIPKLTTLRKIAEALGLELEFSIRPKGDSASLSMQKGIGESEIALLAEQLRKDTEVLRQSMISSYQRAIDELQSSLDKKISDAIIQESEVKS